MDSGTYGMLKKKRVEKLSPYLGGGNSKYFWNVHPEPWGRFSPILTSIIFQLGWFNHQPATYKVFVAVAPIDSYFTALPPLLLDPWIPRMHHCHTIHIVLPVSSIGILDSTKTRSAPKPVPLISWLVNLPPCKVPP